MLRVLRIIGIVVFAALVAFSAHQLQKLYTSGTLFEQYNSARKANVTLLGVSVSALGVLGFFELARERNHFSTRRGYGGVPVRRQKTPVETVGVTSSIYAAPETIDAWQGRRTRPPKSRHKQAVDLSGVWMSLLRICCMVLSLSSAGLLVLQLATGFVGAHESVWLTGFLAFMTIFSGVTVWGVVTKKVWGLTCGYLLAICNLLIFPFGTVAGLIMLLGLVGATPLFVQPARERRRAAREKGREKAKTAVI